MIVCVCHRISDRDIASAAHAGCASFEELQFELAVATACGKCQDCARDTFHQHAALSQRGFAAGEATLHLPHTPRRAVVHIARADGRDTNHASAG